MNKNYLPFVYGILVSISYIIFKYIDLKGGLYIFFASCSILLLVSICINPKKFLTALNNKFLNYRGLIFALSHIFIFIAQISGFTSDIIVSSISGSIIGTSLSHLLLKEKLTKSLILSSALCLLIWFIYPAIYYVKILGLVTGLLIASLMISSRYAAKAENSIITILQISFLYGSILSFFSIICFYEVQTLSELSSQDILIATIILLSMQIFYIYMFKHVEASKASVLILSRVPASYLFEFLVFERTIPYYTLFLGTLILIISSSPILLSFFKPRISNP